MSTRRWALAARRVVMGHTQESLADQLGVERSTIVRWERGSSTPQPWCRPMLATALAISTDDLAALLSGDAMPTSVRFERDAVLAQLPALRRVIDAHDLPTDGPVRSLAELQKAVNSAINNRLQSKYAVLALELPTLLSELTRAFQLHTGTPREDAVRLLVQAYRAADAIADKFGYHDLSARIIGLMRWAADESGDELLIATAAYVRTETFFANGDLATGRRALQQAADRLVLDGGNNAAATYGALHMRAAVIAARAGQAAAAEDHLRESARVARNVKDGIYFGTAFGPASVRIHQLSLAVELGNSDAAIRIAAGREPPATVPAERRSHFYVDLSRAYLQTAQDSEALQALFTARAAAPEHIRSHPHVRDAVDDLLRNKKAPNQLLVDFERWLHAPARPTALGGQDPEARSTN
jgi:DNA-binding XRE family transcriptional regulator